jgi:hypothetical protein
VLGALTSESRGCSGPSGIGCGADRGAGILPRDSPATRHITRFHQPDLAGAFLRELTMRSILVCGVGVLALMAGTLSQASCASDSDSIQAAADAPIGIETGQLFVTVENRAGGPLLDLRITVQTPSAPYTYMITRLEAGQKRDVPVSSFSSRDGTGLNLRLVRPRSVRAAAKDLVGKTYDAQAPWK